MQGNPADPPGTRREARERAMAILYEAAAKGSTPEEVLKELPVAPEPFVCELVSGVGGNLERIDSLISSHSIGWAIDRMPLVDIAIVRIGVFELLERPDTSLAVIASEAVELAKQYSTEESSRFVNGVLSAIAGELRPGMESR